MEAEFDTVAEWTADVAADLGPSYYLPAACRGSGSPPVLQWLVDRLGITAADRMLDCGAGVGGPAACAAEQVGVRPILTDPEAGACRGARRLFGLPAVRAEAGLPFRTGAFDVAWSLGVLCTVADQPAFLRELRRVMAPSARLGLLVFLAVDPPLSKAPQGNNFPTRDSLASMLADAGFAVEEHRATDDLGSTPQGWKERSEAVDAELARRHKGDPQWETAVRQSALMGELLGRGELVAGVLVARCV